MAEKSARAGRVSRVEQKLRTRAAIVEACRTLIVRGEEVTMPAVAQAAEVSEATAYRHFSDLVSLVNEALGALWPSPAEALAEVDASPDPVERVGCACEFLLRRVWAYQGSVRAVIAATIVRPASVPQRPGFRFGLIDHAVDPAVTADGEHAREAVTRLKQDLAAVMSAEALFSLTDLCGLDVDRAVASLVHTAQTITRVALEEIGDPADASGDAVSSTVSSR